MRTVSPRAGANQPRCRPLYRARRGGGVPFLTRPIQTPPKMVPPILSCEAAGVVSTTRNIPPTQPPVGYHTYHPQLLKIRAYDRLLGGQTVSRITILRHGEMRIARCGIRTAELFAYGLVYGTSVTVSLLRPSRSPTHKWGYDTSVPFSWRPWLLAATPSPRPGRTICSSLCHSLSSWALLQ